MVHKAAPDPKACPFAKHSRQPKQIITTYQKLASFRKTPTLVQNPKPMHSSAQPASSFFRPRKSMQNNPHPQNWLRTAKPRTTPPRIPPSQRHVYMRAVRD